MRKFSLLNLAEELENVSEACWIRGICPSCDTQRKVRMAVYFDSGFEKGVTGALFK
jgi:hypothetical protein